MRVFVHADLADLLHRLEKARVEFAQRRRIHRHTARLEHGVRCEPVAQGAQMANHVLQLVEQGDAALAAFAGPLRRVGVVDECRKRIDVGGAPIERPRADYRVELLMLVEKRILQFVEIPLGRFDRTLLRKRIALLMRLPQGNGGIERDGRQDRNERQRRD
jgi:hypothetical protein